MLTFSSSEAVSICRVLRQLGSEPGLPARIHTAARFWADEVRPGMPREDLQTVVWLLEDVGAHRRLPRERREEARYWAAYLDSTR
jgi:hypothetical protein